MAGESATHAAVYAQLIIDGTCHGLQTFIVPIRCRRTGRPEPNVTVGDMGAKMGRNGLDNGWIQFDHKRVPREAMLMRWASVDPAGKFTPPPSKQISYNALLATRVELFGACSEVLKKALTIAVRYALVRRQSVRKDDLAGAGAGAGSAKETLLLDYPTHQSLLFPILAHTFALHFTAKQTQAMCDSALKGLAATGGLSALPELHATSSGLKAVGTWFANDALESCRQSLGGMGYSQYSVLAQMRADWAVMATWEGDNTVLSLQCARFLIKQQVAIAKGRAPSGVTRYLAEYDSKQRAPAQMTEQQWLDPAWQMEALRHRAARKVREVTRLLDQEAKAAQISYAAAFERLSAQCVVVSRLHCYAFMLQCFGEGVARAPKELQPVLALSGAHADAHAHAAAAAELARARCHCCTCAHRAAIMLPLCCSALLCSVRRCVWLQPSRSVRAAAHRVDPWRFSRGRIFDRRARGLSARPAAPTAAATAAARAAAH